MRTGALQWSVERGGGPLPPERTRRAWCLRGIQWRAVLSRPRSDRAVGGESPERNADPQARTGRPVPPGCQGRAVRKGSGHPEECEGLPRIVHVGTRGLRETDGLRLLGTEPCGEVAPPAGQQGLPRRVGPTATRDLADAGTPPPSGPLWAAWASCSRTGPCLPEGTVGAGVFRALPLPGTAAAQGQG